MPEELFAKAIEKHKQGALDEAKECYLEVLRKYPKHDESMYLLSIVNMQQDHYEEAFEWITKTISIKDNEVTYYNGAGNILKKMHRFDEAIKYLNKALLLEPNNAQTHNNLAILLYQQDNFEEAIKHYAKAVNLQPDYLDAHFNLGLLFLRQGQMPEAITQFENVIALQPKHLLATKNLADLYMQCDQLEKAKKYYKYLLATDPKNIEALNNMGVALLKLELPEKAISYFTKVLEIDEAHIDARNNLAASYLQQDRYENAMRHYKDLLKHQPDDTEVLYNLAVSQMAIGEIEEAKKNFQHVIENKHDHVDALCNLAALFIKLNSHEQARIHYKKALEFDPKNPIAEYMLHALDQEHIPEGAPKPYVKNLFDNYAGYYDKHVTEVLRYNVPSLLRSPINQIAPHPKQDWRILDLGCGTGLIGTMFLDYAKRLVGVDISPKMIYYAGLKGIYDELIEDDIQSVLETLNETFTFIVAADLFVYIGDLQNIFRQCYKHLEQDGLFAFSVESAIDNNRQEKYILNKTARYAHTEEYIKALAEENGFLIEAFEEIIPRYQENKPVNGYLVVFRKRV